MILIACYFSFLTFQSWQTAHAWSSRTFMTINGYLQHPYSVRANLEMTQLLADQGNFQQSLQVNAQILELRPDAALRSYIQRFYLYCKVGERCLHVNMTRSLALSSLDITWNCQLPWIIFLTVINKGNAVLSISEALP